MISLLASTSRVVRLRGEGAELCYLKILSALPHIKTEPHRIKSRVAFAIEPFFASCVLFSASLHISLGYLAISSFRSVLALFPLLSTLVLSPSCSSLLIVTTY